jgi:hypothetical protein
MGINLVDFKKLVAENLENSRPFLELVHGRAGFSAKLRGKFELHVDMTEQRIGFRVATTREQFSLFHAILPRDGNRGWLRTQERIPGMPVYERCLRVTPESLASYISENHIGYSCKIPNSNRKTKDLSGRPLERGKLVRWLRRKKCMVYFEFELLMDDSDWKDEALIAGIVNSILWTTTKEVIDFDYDKEIAGRIREDIQSISEDALEFLSKKEPAATDQLLVLRLIGGTLSRCLQRYLDGQGKYFGLGDYQSCDPEKTMPEKFKELLFDGIDHIDFNKWRQSCATGRELQELFTELAGIYAAIFSYGVSGKQFHEHTDFWVRQSFRQNARYLELSDAPPNKVPARWKDEFKENYHLVMEGMGNFTTKWRGLPKHSLAIISSYGLLDAIQKHHSGKHNDTPLKKLAADQIRSYVRSATLRLM